ncbi:MlaE family ABC transporter permease [candidate division CSSED10-310 bacterium]|uniref:MlaE family ABC transporter permease n=1 Tax=candidate division CSSED10-310 bacterium TaxID=2855610 RepID=A0ABV6Z5V8_UNCC1
MLKIDRSLLSILSATGDFLILSAKVISSIFRVKFHGRHLLQYIDEMGTQSLPLVAITIIFTGMVLAVQTSHELVRFGAQMYVSNIVCLSIVRELSPILTALVCAGRVGARITAELGSMRVSEQIRAMRALAIDPVSFLIAPMVLAFVIVLPLLTLVADFVGILGGYLISVISLGANSSAYITSTIDALELSDVVMGLFKAFFFAAIISLISAYKGRNTTGGTTGVGIYTTSSVVTSSLLILVSDFFFTKAYILFFE